MPSLPARIFAYVFIRFLCVAGPVFLLISAATGLGRARFVHSSLSAEGVVVDFHYISAVNRPNTWTCAPIFRFTAKDGRSFTVTSDIGQNPCPWRVGDGVRVLYKENHPEHAYIDSFFQLWLFPVVCGFLGGVCTVFPLRVFFLRRSGSLSGSPFTQPISHGEERSRRRGNEDFESQQSDAHAEGGSRQTGAAQDELGQV